MLIYALVLLGIAAWQFLPRPWWPSVTVRTPHYVIYSTASRQHTDQMAHALELLYGAYSTRFGTLTRYDRGHPRLALKLFRDRAQFRWVNPRLGWAEAYYRRPYCRAYYSSGEVNPYHWMLHESVHQLNREVAHLALAKWLDEGLATYLSTSRLAANELAVGRIDANTYPVWWIDEIATSPDMAENVRNGSVIPLRAIVTNRGGPSMNDFFNLYYVHWWTLAYFIFESPRYRERAVTLVQRGGGLDAFEQILGPVEQVQAEWHAFVHRLKRAVAGRDVDLWKSGSRLESSDSSREVRTAVRVPR